MGQDKETSQRAPWGSHDKLGRWRSARWRKWVRSLGCSCKRLDCNNCGSGGLWRVAIHAAHLRSPSTGMGAKPDDFLCYPLASTTHGRFHNKGQPARAWQLERVAEVWAAAFATGVATAAPSHAESLQGIFRRVCESYTDYALELATIEVRNAFHEGVITVGQPSDLGLLVVF